MWHLMCNINALDVFKNTIVDWKVTTFTTVVIVMLINGRSTSNNGFIIFHLVLALILNQAFERWLNVI